MSIFGAIKDAIWGKAKAAAPAPAPVAAAAAPAAAPVMDTPPQNVDVTALLDSLAANHDEKLNWRVSIVDLMKLIGLDASLHNRQELATELGYSGEKNGSAEMNIWLHKQVMVKLAENGGTIPEELTH